VIVVVLGNNWIDFDDLVDLSLSPTSKAGPVRQQPPELRRKHAARELELL
jgi:hypothetical protein